MYQDSDRCWEIFNQKNNAYDGVFVVGVMSTKIYCRPSCSARPHRKNVRFFADNASAQRAGLRPCKRCTPDGLSPEYILCQRVCRYIESSVTTPSLAKLAQAIGYSPFHLQRTFKHVMGISPFAYAHTVKWLRVQDQLAEPTSIHDAIMRAGFGSISGYYHAHTQHKLVRQLRHIKPIYIGQCLYRGFVVVGIFHALTIQYCGIYVDEAHAYPSLRRLLGWDSVPISESHSASLEALIQALSISSISSAIDMDIRATAFQHRVWRAIRQIPLGETRHYHEIASAIGQPAAIRAVANACAQNPLAILTPCHRVVPEHEGTGNYRWGSAIKAKLLEAEQTATYNRQE